MNSNVQLYKWIWGIPIGVFLLRCLFQGLIFPWELSGDEAQYWDWTRHPALSYYTKGPGVTWFITATTTLFGDNILGIRIGSFLFHAIAGIAVGSIALQISGNDRKVVLTTVLAYQFLLGYQIAGSLMTVDMMMVSGWSVATWATIRVVQMARSGDSVTFHLCLIGAAMGFSFLAKYTALLGLLGLLIGVWPNKALIKSARGYKAGICGAALSFSLGMLPVILWNATRGWPTVEHLLGHLHVPGGDSGTTSWLEYDPLWTLQFALQLLGLAGPILGYLLLRGAVAALERGSSTKADLRIPLWSALPVMGFYLLVSLKGPTEGNWIVGAYAPLLPLGMLWLSQHHSLFTQKILLLLIAIRGTLTGGLLLLLMAVAPSLNSGLQSLGLKPLPLHRVAGHSLFAEQLQQIAIDEKLESAPIICNYYDKTALLAYYLPGKPTVFCASVTLGSRPSAYDDFKETIFPAPRFSGQTVILVGSTIEAWQHALAPEEIKELGILEQRGRPRSVFRAKLGRFEKSAG